MGLARSGRLAVGREVGERGGHVAGEEAHARLCGRQAGTAGRGDGLGTGDGGEQLARVGSVAQGCCRAGKAIESVGVGCVELDGMSGSLPPQALGRGNLAHSRTDRSRSTPGKAHTTPSP